MLVLSRGAGQATDLFQDGQLIMKVVVLGTKNGVVKVGFKEPTLDRDIKVLREELSDAHRQMEPALQSREREEDDVLTS